MTISPLTTPLASEPTLERCAVALETLAGQTTDLVHNGTEYTNIVDWLASRRDKKRYTVIEPRYADSQLSDCVRAGAAEGLTCTPASSTSEGSDGFKNESVCEHHDCNAWLDSNGKMHVYAIRGQDNNFSLNPGLSPTGVQMDVCVLTPVLYYQFTQTDFTNIHSWSTSQLDGMHPQPGAFYADGDARGYMLYAKYAGGKDANGKLRSASGLPLWNRTMSHNAVHTAGAARGTGYSGKTIVDDWYIKSMIMLKYGTKNSQTVFAGCSSYNYQYALAKDEDDTTRVILTDAQAANLLVGSYVMLGSATSAPDRNSANAYSVFDGSKILSKEALTGEDTGYTAVYIDTDEFDAVAGTFLSTAPYWPGYCDSVLGSDGSPISRSSGKEPFVIQGIECMVGATEVLADVILKGSPAQEVWVCYDSDDYDTSITSDYVKVGEFAGTPSAWNYEKEFTYAGGMLLPQGAGADSSKGIGDGWYLPAEGTSLYEWPGFGSLLSAGSAGASCVPGSAGLSAASWAFASRLSLIGQRLAS